MPARDLILTAYASSERSPCLTWAKKWFNDEPIVLSVPGPPGSLLRTGKHWAATGDVFQAALKELAPQLQGVEIRRKGIVTFLSGWNFVNQLLLSPFEVRSLDACVILEGIHTKNLDPWVQLASRAVRGEAWMLMAHGNTVSKDSNGLIFKQATEGSGTHSHQRLPDYVVKPTLPLEGVYIQVPPLKDIDGRIVMPAQTKHWVQDRLTSETNRGNLYMLTYDGYERPDHKYLVEWVQPRIWRFLADYWNTLKIL